MTDTAARNINGCAARQNPSVHQLLHRRNPTGDSAATAVALGAKIRERFQLPGDPGGRQGE